MLRVGVCCRRVAAGAAALVQQDNGGFAAQADVRHNAAADFGLLSTRLARSDSGQLPPHVARQQSFGQLLSW